MNGYRKFILGYFLFSVVYAGQTSHCIRPDQSCFRLNLTTANYNKRLDHRFMTSVITSSLNQCLDTCMYHTSCLSINYEQRSNTCEFLQVNATIMGSLISTENGYIHLDLADWVGIRTNDPCSIKPCGMNKQCSPKWSECSYECLDVENSCYKVYLVTGHYGIPDSQLTASSAEGNEHDVYGAHKARLNADSSWDPMSESQPYIQAEFNTTERILGVATQGHHDTDDWVESYHVAYSVDCTGFFYIFDQSGDKKLFEGNYNHYAIKINFLDEEIKARCVRIYPEAAHGYRTMRFDVVGCLPEN